MAEGPIIHVDGTRPGDPALVDAESIAVVDMAIQHGRQQVVRGRNRVEITGKVEVDLLHGDHLRVAATGRPALDAEHRPKGRFPESHDDFLA